MTKITRELVKSRLPKRPDDANKGTFGKALIIAGSKNFPGAAILSVMAAARTGVGFVTLATIPEVYEVAVPKIPFSTFLDFSEVEHNLSKYDSVLIGPGLGQSVEVQELVNKIIRLNPHKLIIDADGLNVLSGINGWFKILEDDAILTPHPGEMSRLTGLSIEEIQNKQSLRLRLDREKIAKKYAKLWNKTVVLKGAETVIATLGGDVYKSEFANPLLATAGTGDVLAGIIAGLLAQGLSLIDASIVGVYIHGTVGEKLKEKFGDSGATALDLVEAIPQTTMGL